MMAVRVNIEKKMFPGHTVLQNIRFEIAQQEIVAVVAPSGAGKSTLLNIVAGLDKRFAGSVERSAAAAANCAVVFQEPRLLPWLNARRNVELAATCKRAPDAWLERMEIPQASEQYPQQLSIGMQRRVAIARALAAKPQLLLLDEAFVSLDRPLADRMRQVVMNYASQLGAAVLLATHDLREAVACSDRIIFLSATPAGILLDIDVPLERPREAASSNVHAFCLELEQRYPLLLAGSGEQQEAS